MSTRAFTIEPARVREVPPDGVPVDLAPLRELGDSELVSELAVLFIDSTPPLMAEIRDALARGDAAGVALAAHSVKGASANMTAEPLARAAAALEDAGKRRDLAAMLTLVEAVESSFREAAAYLVAELGLTA